MHKNSELWGEEYKAFRYMEYLSEKELARRLKDVVENLTSMSKKGGFHLKWPDNESDYFFMLWSHIRKEYVLRGQGYAYGITMGKIPPPRACWPAASRAIEAISRITQLNGNFLIKYGKRKHLQKTYDEGLIRLSPASFYDDPSLNPAVKDKELELTVEALPREAELYLVDEHTGEKKQRLSPINNIEVTFLSKSDYYVYCMSHAYDIRLFHDFDADCCLIIKNPKEFIERLITAFHDSMPGYIDQDQRVKYIDPLTSSGKIDVFFSKHFRYAYQKEFRIVWLPPSLVRKFDAVVLDLGSLTNCTEIFML